MTTKLRITPLTFPNIKSKLTKCYNKNVLINSCMHGSTLIGMSSKKTDHSVFHSDIRRTWLLMFEGTWCVRVISLVVASDGMSLPPNSFCLEEIYRPINLWGKYFHKLDWTAVVGLLPTRYLKIWWPKNHFQSAFFRRQLICTKQKQTTRKVQLSSLADKRYWPRPGCTSVEVNFYVGLNEFNSYSAPSLLCQHSSANNHWWC